MTIHVTISNEPNEDSLESTKREFFEYEVMISKPIDPERLAQMIKRNLKWLTD